MACSLPANPPRPESALRWPRGPASTQAGAPGGGETPGRARRVTRDRSGRRPPWSRSGSAEQAASARTPGLVGRRADPRVDIGGRHQQGGALRAPRTAGAAACATRAQPRLCATSATRSPVVFDRRRRAPVSQSSPIGAIPIFAGRPAGGVDTASSQRVCQWSGPEPPRPGSTKISGDFGAPIGELGRAGHTPVVAAAAALDRRGAGDETLHRRRLRIARGIQTPQQPPTPSEYCLQSWSLLHWAPPLSGGASAPIDPSPPPSRAIGVTEPQASTDSAATTASTNRPARHRAATVGALIARAPPAAAASRRRSAAAPPPRRPAPRGPR